MKYSAFKKSIILEFVFKKLPLSLIKVTYFLTIYFLPGTEIKFQRKPRLGLLPEESSKGERDQGITTSYMNPNGSTFRHLCVSGPLQ